MKCYLIILLILAQYIAHADQIFPSSDWKDELDPLASADAEIGGEIVVFSGQQPQSYNAFLDNSVTAQQVFSLMYETLLSRHSVNLNYEPALAEKWSISEDKKTYTFWINKKAKWSDGAPITAEDVKWTFDTVMDPKNLTGPHKVSLETFQTPKILDKFQIQFTAKEVHWRNLMAIGSLDILPKHSMENKDFNKINFEFPVVSGPYRMGETKESIFVKMERRGDWWGRALKRNQGIGNFQTIKYKYFAERPNAFEAFKKGQIDLYPVYTARLWVNETKGEKVDKNWIIKQKIYNYDPSGFQGFAMNMRKPPFNDLKVRKAMGYLVNRGKMNNTLMYNQYFLHRSYVEDLYSKSNPCPNELIPFDKEKARQLLSEAGWKVNPETGILEKDKIPFSFKFLTRAASSDKFLAIFSEDLKDVGINLEVDKKDWAAWSKDMDEFNFSMTWAAWGGSTFKDPEGMWSSKEAERKSGNNITGFQNKEVDELIEQQKTIFDLEKRNEINRKIDQITYKDFPYALLWNINYTRLLYWNKFGTPDTVLSKYGDERSAYMYWWHDEDAVIELKDAQKNGTALPRKEKSVKFDDVFEQ